MSRNVENRDPGPYPVGRRAARRRDKTGAVVWLVAVLLIVATVIGFSTGLIRSGSAPKNGDEGQSGQVPGDGGNGDGTGDGTGGSGSGSGNGNGSGIGDANGDGAGNGDANGREHCTEAKAALLEKASEARGVYLTIPAVGTPAKMTQVVTFVREHPGLNAFVVDLKDNHGQVPCPPPEGVPSRSAGYRHYPVLIRELARQGYYMAARIVAFQDPYIAVEQPDLAIRKADGSLWRDRDGRLWLNPYDKRNWEHVINTALWALEMGFHEIQLDYVRFPDSASGIESSTLMPGSEDFRNRGHAISEFLKYMADQLGDRALLCADIFGFTTIAADDMGIGQKLEEVSDSVDIISPMVYPSHYYNKGIYGFDVPEAHPYEVVGKAMDEALERTEGLRVQVIRPWLQDFSMRIKYGAKEVQDQINAVFERGINTFLLWNPSNVYTDGVEYRPPGASSD
ncbi:MAG: putative glycoside hydrolase [Bacillota bacterium]|jgi:hypothetical protein